MDLGRPPHLKKESRSPAEVSSDEAECEKTGEHTIRSYH